MSLWVACWGALSLLQLWPARCLANDFADFQRARNTYESGHYKRAAELFEELVGGEVPRLQNRSLVLESLKYLAATYLFLGHAHKAEEQITRLLRLDLEYVLDPLAFPEEMQKVFSRVKSKMEVNARMRAEEEVKTRERQLLEEVERREAQAERTSALLELARTERVEEQRSRWTALIPFGVGQFQNGDSSLGLLLLVSEGVLLGASVTTFLLHRSLDGRVPEDAGDKREAELVEQALRYANWTSVGVLSLVAAGGVIDAQLRFEPTRTYERRRALPPELEKSIEVSFSGTGVRVAF